MYLYVKDTGIGIAQENLQVVFDRFRKIEDNKNTMYRGTGLGLAITKFLAELLHGDIWAESELGKGSEFTFKLPMESEQREYGKQTDMEGNIVNPHPNWKNKVVLVVEDETTNFNLIKELLSETSIEILWAKDGIEAIETFGSNRGRIDIVLLDIKIPHKNGYEVVKEIKQINDKIPVIAQTAYAMANDEESILNSGFDAYLSKPIEADRLFEEISKLFAVKEGGN